MAPRPPGKTAYAAGRELGLGPPKCLPERKVPVMLSVMESAEEMRERLRVAERAAAAPFVDYPPDPWWVSPAFGLWAAVLVLVVGGFGGGQVWRVVALLALAAMQGIFLGWQRKRRGAWPRGAAPAEIRRALLGFSCGTAVVIAVGAVLWWLAPLIAAAAGVFIIVTAGVASYELAYDRAAARTRKRLG